MVTHITDYLLYRWRYVLGYGLIGLLVIGLMLIAWLHIPGGLSQNEMQTVAESSSLSLSLQVFDSDAVINMPYHLLQRVSLELLGTSTLSIKLPSFILGLLSAAGILLLLRMWFKQNVAVLTTVLIITTGQLLFLAQSGTPAIVYIFWPVWLLYAALMVSRKERWTSLWKAVLFGTAALSLYTPFAVYVLLALLSAGALHPHLRYLFRQLSKVKLALGCICALVLIAPLIYAIVRHPSVGFQLLGIPETWPNLSENVMTLLNRYFSFANPGESSLMTPIYGLGPIALIALGLVRLFTTKYTARSYIIIAWIILLMPLMLISPEYVSITFVPGMLLMAMGVSLLLSRWYSLFPRNPYARFAGLLPLIVLIGGMMFSGIDRYMYGYLYTPPVVGNFSTDLDLLNAQLSDKERGTTTLVTPENTATFYNAVAKYHANLTVITDIAAASATPPQTTIVSRGMAPPQNAGTIWRIVANGMSQESDRFYIYKTTIQ